VRGQWPDRQCVECRRRRGRTITDRPVLDNDREVTSTAASKGATVIARLRAGGPVRLRSHSLPGDSALFAPRESECACLLSDIHWAPANIVDYTFFCYATLSVVDSRSHHCADFRAPLLHVSADTQRQMTAW